MFQVKPMQTTHHVTEIVSVPKGPERARRQAAFARPTAAVYAVDDSRTRAKPEAVKQAEPGLLSRLMSRSAPSADNDPFVMRLARLG